MRTLKIILIILLSASSLYAQKGEDIAIKSKENKAYESYLSYTKSENYDNKKAIRLLEKAAKANNSNAQLKLAFCYFRGTDVPIHHQKAINLFKKAAELNNYTSQLTLAMFYKNGACSLKKDLDKAIYYCELAAKHEKPAPLYYLGKIYESTEKEDLEKAFDLYLKAAKLGYESALECLENLAEGSNKKSFDVAMLYKDKDADKALNLFKSVLEDNAYKDDAMKEIISLADSGNDNAQYELANFYEEGKYIKVNVNKAIHYYELAAKQENAYSYKKILDYAKEDYPQAQYTMGYIYHNGIYQTKNLDKAIDWYTKAVRKNNKDAIPALIQANNERNADIYLYLGNAYRIGIGVEKNDKKAFNFYKESAKLGSKDSMTNLGMCYEKAVGVKQNYKIAFKHYLKGANLGDETAQFNLAKAYTHARGVKQNYEEALKWFQKSADQNYIHAIVDLGIAYEKGYGTEVDMEKATELFMRASKRDDTFAMFKIASFYECGHILEKDLKKALELYKKAAILGNKDALEVVEEYRQAAENGDRQAQILFNNLVL